MARPKQEKQNKEFLNVRISEKAKDLLAKHVTRMERGRIISKLIEDAFGHL